MLLVYNVVFTKKTNNKGSRQIMLPLCLGNKKYLERFPLRWICKIGNSMNVLYTSINHTENVSQYFKSVFIYRLRNTFKIPVKHYNVLLVWRQVL